MGLECLSRGARQAVFFEMDRSALQRLRQNIGTLNEHSRSRVIAGDLFKWFAAPVAQDVRRADLVFLDPPYRFLRQRPDDLRRLTQQMADNHLTAEGQVIFRHDAADELRLSALHEVDRREYGGMTIEFLKRT